MDETDSYWYDFWQNFTLILFNDDLNVPPNLHPIVGGTYTTRCC